VAGRSSLAQANRTAKQTLNHCNSDIKERCNVAMTAKVVGSSSRYRIFDPIVQIGYPPNFPIEVERIVDDDPETIHQPRGSAASSKGGSS